MKLEAIRVPSAAPWLFFIIPPSQNNIKKIKKLKKLKIVK